MTPEGEVAAYRHVADGGLAAAAVREGTARIRRLVPTLGVVVLLLGLWASLRTNAESLPEHLPRVLLIGVVWALAWAVFLMVLLAVLLPVSRMMNRRTMTRMFAAGSVTEVELDQQALVIRRPTGTRTIGYRDVALLQPRGSFLVVVVRGLRPSSELLPVDLLPADAVELVRTRSRGAWPAPAATDDRAPGCEWVVPPGWSTRFAAVSTLSAMRGRRFWTGVLVRVLVAVLVAAVLGPEWLLLAPALVVLGIVLTFVATRRDAAVVLPTGSRASTEFHEDHFISRNASRAREYRLEDIRSVEVRHGLVTLRLASSPVPAVFARSLFPDDQLARLQELARQS